MKRNIKYTCSVVPGKLRCEVRISVEENKAEYTSDIANGDKSTSISLFPIVTLSIFRPMELDENGRRKKAVFNPNDSLGMTHYSMSVFLGNLKQIRKEMETPELYVYHGKRLELNEELAKKFRNPFKIGNVIVELSVVVITQPDESRVEGIKLKFNNEQSSVLLTLNDIDALIFNLSTMDVDSLALLLYLNYVRNPDGPTEFNSNTSLKSNVDILPKEKDFDSDFE